MCGECQETIYHLLMFLDTNIFLALCKFQDIFHANRFCDTVAISTYQIEAWQTLRPRRSGHHGFFAHPTWLVHIHHHDVIPLTDWTFLNGRLNFDLQILQEISVYSCGCPWVQLNTNSNIPSLQLQLQFPISNKWYEALKMIKSYTKVFTDVIELVQSHLWAASVCISSGKTTRKEEEEA